MTNTKKYNKKIYQLKQKKKEIILTEFQIKVYAACKTIPSGETRTYKWIAEQIGCPRSCRAVGNALHKNPFAPSVPCHRVIRNDGTLGGFAQGSRRKKALLQREKNSAIRE